MKWDVIDLRTVRSITNPTTLHLMQAEVKTQFWTLQMESSMHLLTLKPC